MLSFKKSLCTLLSCLMILQTSPISLAADEESKSSPAEKFSLTDVADEKYAFYEDFEGDAKSFTTTGSCYQITDAPEREGKALANHYTGKGNGQIRKVYNEDLPLGRYHFSFDFYTEDFSSGIAIVLQGLGETYSIADIRQSGKLTFRRAAQSNRVDANLSTGLKANTWYSFMIWVDTENREVTVTLDGTLIARMPLNEKLKTFTGFIITNSNNGTKPGRIFFDNMKFYRVADDKYDNMSPFYVDVKTADDVIANNFFKDNPPKFNLTYINRLDKEINAKISYRVYTRADNELVWSTEDAPEEISLEADGSLNHPMEVGREYFGRFNLDIIIDTDEGQYTHTIPYSMSNHTEDMPNNPRVGVASHISHSKGDYKLQIPLQAQAGIGGLRDEICWWAGVEKSKGVYDFSGEPENKLKLMDEHDIFYIYRWTSGTPSFYNEPNGGRDNLFPVTKEGLEGLKNYMKELVKFADGRIDVVELWNEYQNMSGIYQGKYEYEVAYHKAAYEGVKAGDPNVELSAFDTDRYGFYTASEISKCLELMNGEKMFDTISIHPYPSQGGTPPERAILRSFPADIADTLEAYGYDRDTKLYFTELGISDLYLNDDRLKASHTIRNMAIPHIYGTGEGVFIHSFNDYMIEYDASNAEAFFGIVDDYDAAGDEIPYLGKESFVALAYYNNLMAQAEAVQVIDTGKTDEDYAYHFRHRDGSDILMMGPIDNKPASFAFDLGCNSVIAGDIYGNERIIYGIDGKYNFTVDGRDILYIKGNFGKVELTEPLFAMSVREMDVPVNYSFTISSTAPQGFDGEMRVTSSNGVELINESSLFADGKAELSFKTFAAPVDMADIYVEIIKDNNIYHSARIPLKYTSSGVLDGDLRWRLSGGRYDLWDLQMDIKNVRADTAITGKYVSDTGQSFVIPEIAPGETRRITIPIPQITDRSQLGTVNGRLEYSTGDYTVISEDKESVAIPRTYNPPKIDGVFGKGEWNTSPALSIKSDKQKYVIGGSATWGGPGDLSYDAYLSYDLDNIYVAVRVRDDVFRNVRDIANLWDGDSVQVLIGYEEQNQGTQFGMALVDGKPSCYRYVWEGALAGLADIHHAAVYEDGEVGITHSGMYTYYEASFPWDKIRFEGGEITPGQYIYFSVAANDDDHTTNEVYASNKNRDLYMEVVNCITAGSNYNYRAVKSLLLP